MFVLKTLIDRFWVKYAQIHHAVCSGETFLIDFLDGEIDPLLTAIENTRAETVEDARLQFQFLLELLKREAEDQSNVLRHSNALSRLAERYFVERDTGHFGVRDGAEPTTPALVRAEGPTHVSETRADRSGFDAAAMEGLEDRVSVIGLDYRYIYLNKANAERLGEPVSQLVGRSVVEFLGLQSFETSIKPALDRCFAGEQVDGACAHEVDGQTIVIQFRMKPCMSRAGRLIGATVVHTQLADRRRNRAA
jgi:PAS domain-containing protein